MVKYDNTSTPDVWINGPINCLTTPYRPAVFTAKDDISVGETIGTAPLTINSYGHVALIVNYYQSTLSNLRISYVRGGIDYILGTHTLWHSQFNYTTEGVYTYGGSDVSLRNVLFDWMYDNAFAQFSGSIHGQNLTIHHARYLSYLVSTQTLDLVNSVGSSRVDLQACKLEYSIVSPK